MEVKFKGMTAADVVDEILAEIEEKDVSELGFYLVINDTFYPIDKIEVLSGAITVYNTANNHYYTVDTTEEDMIFKMVNINEWQEIF